MRPYTSLQVSPLVVPTTSRFLWNYFGISSVDIFYFLGRKGKILRTYRLILPKYHLILPRKFFLPTWKIKNIPVECPLPEKSTQLGRYY